MSDPPAPAPRQLLLVPEVSRRFLSTQWEDQARAAGALVIAGEETRERFAARLWAELPDVARSAGEVSPDPFYALALARIWLDMLTAYMKHVATLDEALFLKEVLAAASTAMIGDLAARDEHLRAAFQLLTEARERIYGADVHLLDLCLLDPRAGMDKLTRQLATGHPQSLFASGRTIEELKRRDPAATAELRASLERGSAELVGGEYDELASTILPLESHLWQFARGGRAYREVLERVPLVYGRRRFGLARHVLQLLNRHEFLFFTHFCFDDGRFPVKPDPKVRWEAPDSSTVEGLARIPFAADSAVNYLKFPHLLAQTMAADFVATLAMVHWPMPDIPWYGELLAMNRFANVFARLTNLSSYFQSTDPPSISSTLSNDDYASPYLESAHRADSPRAVSECPRRHRLRAAIEQVQFLRAVHGSIWPATASHEPDMDELESDMDELESRAELLAPEIDRALEQAARRATESLARGIAVSAGAARPGLVVMNPTSFERRVLVPLDAAADPGTAPLDLRRVAATGPVRALTVPPFGFAWTPLEPDPHTASQSPVLVAEHVMTNDHLEVEIDTETGGIRAIRERHRRTPLLGQQLVLAGIAPGRTYSYDPTPGADVPGDGGYGVETSGSRMRANRIDVHTAGPDLAQVVTEGDICAEPCPSWTGDPCLARFRQTYSLAAGDSVLFVRVEITDLNPRAIDAHAGPWQSYLASRFAWPDARSVLLRGMGTIAEVTHAMRPETPYFLELHDRRCRTAILTGGLAFHQRIGQRMLDTLLVTATEQCRSFEFGIGVNVTNPFHAALDVLEPVPWARCDGPPPQGDSGWFFHVDVRNVVVTSVAALRRGRWGVRVRLFESAGRYTRARLRCPRNVAEACMTDFQGQRLAAVELQGDTVTLDLAPHEMTQLEIEFGQL